MAAPNTIHALVGAQILRTPDVIAVACDGIQLSYRELGVRVERVAGWLAARGVTRGAHVTVAVDRTADMVVAVLGVLRIGAAYVPIDPEYPAHRQAFVRTDAGAVLELTDATLREALASSATAPAVSVDAEDVAYVLYTSGSTGNPKGVRVPHRAVVNFLRSMQRAPGLAATDTLLAVTTLSFDIAGLELYLPLITGATLVIANREATRDGHLLARLLHTSRATAMQATPATWRMLLAADWRPSPQLKILCGGEALPPELAAQLLAGGGAVWNLYGPTETTIWSTCAQLVPGQPITLGQAIDNTTLYVLDDALQPAPIGIAGELYIGGLGVALGYHARPDLTAERFVADPFAPADARMYRTGDRVRWLPDGTLAYLGRIDNQVKLRGFRIELGEIEATLRAAPNISEAAVLLREDTPGNPQLVAYVLAAHDLDLAKLEAAIAAALPAYMVPSAFVTLDAFPLTPNGKLDRKALPAPDVVAAPYIAARDATEAALVEIWQDLLGVERVGVHDDFFALGGHSLLATRLLAHLRKRFAVELPVRAVFDAKTIEGLAARLASPPTSIATPALVRASTRTVLSFTQQRLWFLHELEPESPAYQIAHARRLEGIDVELLRRAFETLVQRHESLRTTFPARDGVPQQHVLPPGPWALGVDDARRLERDAQNALLARIATAQRRPFDLATGPLLRTHVVRLSDDELVLFVTLHHIITDGWSDELLWRELWICYDALAAGRHVDLPMLAVQYADYAAWQRGWLQGAELERQLAFWTTQLRDAPEETALPFKGPRPPRQTFAGRSVELLLEPELAYRVRAFARREGASLFMTFAASLRAVLARYTGQTDILLGTAITNRSVPELENVIGMFVNTLVLRNPLAPDDTFATLLAREKAHALAAFDHQHAPFERVVDALGVERSLSRTPVFQVMYVHQGELDAELRGTPVALDPVAMFDLNVETFEQGDRLGLSLIYNTDLFEHALVEQLVHHYVRLLDRVTREPQQVLAAIDVLAPDERQQLLHAWNATQRPYDDALVPALVEAQIDRTPDAIAIVCEGAQLTFRELDLRANQLAHALRARGAGPDQPILLLLERSLDLAVAILAIAKTGAAYLPIQPSTPRDRVHRIATEADVRLVVGHRALAPLVDDLPVQALWLDTDHALLAALPTTRLRVDIAPDALVYVLYTSGSTGTPKGVMISHRALANHMRWMLDEFAFGTDDVILQRTPYQFDASGWELWAPLMCGARMVMVGPERHGDPHHLVQTIRQHRVTVAQFVPTLLSAVLDEETLASTTLTRVFAGGEALTGTLVRRFDAPSCELVNLYGPTETTIDATWARVPRDFAGDHASIGRAVANTTVYVLDAALRPVPVGVAGELYIGGVQLARGYLHRPELTAERFLEDPFVPGGRLYRTGDRVRWTAGGTLAYLGRVDTQVKLRGFRIELGEIEATLRASALVADAAVLLREDTPGNPYLVAYVVPSEGEVVVADLATALATVLPDYMIPSAFVTLAILPLTANGKLDRNALPAPDLTSTAYAAPRDPIEEILAQLWSELLGVERVGIRDDFFALGGNSLLATRVTARIRKLLGVELPVRAIFEAKTLAALAAQVAARRTDADTSVTPPLGRTPRADRPPLSFAQQRLWFLHELAPDSPAYQVAYARRLEGIDVELLRRAFEALVQRHESLRTSFPADDGVPYQRVHPPAPWILGVEDVRGLDASAQGDALARIGAAQHRSFDLANGPLLRTHAVRVTDDDLVLFVTLHHIITDGWSDELLWRELWICYDALAAGRRVDLPPLAVQYADYAAWQRGWLHGAELERQLAFWTTQLRDAPEETALPFMGPRPPRQTFAGRSVELLLEPELAHRVRAFARREGASLFMTFAASLRAVLARYTGQTDILLGTAITNRSVPELENVIGMFVNTLVLRNPLAPDDTFATLLARERAQALAAYDHQHTPFELVVDALGVERSLSRPPVFQVMYVHQGEIDGELRGTPVGLDPVAVFDLNVETFEQGDRLGLSLIYNTDLFEHALVEQLVRHYVHLLDRITREPRRPLAMLDVLSAEEHQQLHAWNATERPYDDARVPALVEAQIDRTPDAIAIVCEGAQLTFRELDLRANQLAHALRARGAGPDQPILLLLERSLELAVAILAIAKTGAAYLPVNPSTPRDRVRHIATEADVRLVVGHRALAPLVDGLPVQALWLDTDHALLAAQPTTRPRVDIAPDALVYVLYTSGSTGTPKGVMISHRALANHMRWMLDEFAFGTDDVILQRTPYQFDASGWELWAPLLCGARMVMVGPERHGDPHHLVQTIRQHRVTVAQFVPTLLSAVLDEETLANTALTRVFAGGEALTGALVRRFDAPASCELVNLYGPTETTIDATWARVPRDVACDHASIGRAVANTTLHVLDTAMRPVPVGVAGELYIGGVQLARGYLHRPDLTAERFVDDPVTGARLYRTGDRVRWTTDGTLAYLGRIDTQVKLRGFRIELGEIEATLRASALVADAAVLLREDTPGNPQLVAYIVPSETELDLAQIRTALASSLPDYMIPSAFVALAALPLTSNGKLDRRALPAPDLTASSTAYAAPRNPIEESLAQIWRELLGVERVGVRDDFFALGGNSLTATRVTARIRKLLGVELPVRSLFEAPTLAALAAQVAARRTDADTSVTPPLGLTPRTDRPPLSFAQQRLWFLHELDPDSPAYQVAYARRLAHVDIEALRRAFQALVERHEILRTSFPADDGVPYQRVHPPAPWILGVEDVRLEPSALAPIGAAQRRPFNLATGPLLRTHVVRVTDDDVVLFVTFHHIITDGGSDAIFWHELWALYDALVEGRRLDLPVMPVQYVDYAAWQRGWLHGAELERQLAFWTTQLRDAPEETALPFKGPRPSHQTFGGRSVELSIDPDLARRLRNLARREGASLFMTFAASLRALLARYTGQADVLVGTAITNRSAPELEGMVGMFINTLVLRNPLRPDDTFATLLAREKAHALAAYDHQHTPFELVVDALGVERSLSRPPVFQVMYVHQGEIDADQRGQAVELASTVALFDLSIDTWERGELLGLSFVYNTDLFEHALVEQLAHHYVHLLERVTREPQHALASLDVLTSEEHQQLHAWNATERPYDDALVPALVEAQIDRTPDAIAIVCEGAQLTFRELDLRANQLAHALRARGAGPDQPILLLLERSLDLAVAILAIAKAGAAYLPVNPSTPRDRVRHIATEADVRLVVGHRALAPLVDDLPVHALWLDTDHALLAALPTTRPRVDIAPDALVYVLYTSGSTGTPKGVMISHRALANHMRWMLDEFAFGTDDVILQRTPYQFDASGWELWAPLLCGARMVMVGPERHGDPHHLVQTIRQHRVTVAQFVPTLLSAVLDEETLANTALTRVFAGGEALTGALVRRFDAPAACELVNLYGPTETTIDTTWARVPRDFAGDHASIGRAVANTTLHVLDAALRPVPIGVAGELYIGGVQLARGYLHRPDLTAERFVDDPVTGARLYRTGDRVRWMPGGTLAYLGRIDTQVKLRGFRIELGEIEATLRASALVADAAVLLREDSPGNPQLVAYIVPKAPDLDVAALRATLTISLPDYMIPSAFVALAALPLTSNGKLDRRALPAPDLTSTAYAAPRDPIEETLAQIWCELLGVERVGIRDDFFALGGNSLTATRVTARIRTLFAVELPVRAVFEAPTVENLAARIAIARASETAEPIAPMRPVPRTTRLPLSHAQHRMWLLQQLEPHSTAYNMSSLRWIRGPLDTEALRAALEDLVHRHESLRTSFPAFDGVPIVELHPPRRWQLVVEDAAGLDQAGLAQLVDDEITRPFDLATGPLLRTRLLQTRDAHLLILALHHIVTDGWSMSVLWSELEELYAARVQQRAPALPPLAIQYVDYAVWQRERLTGSELERQLHYWTEQLRDAPTETLLPLKGPRPPRPSHRDRSVVTRLSPALSLKLQLLAKREGATLFMTLLAALRALLARYTGQSDLVIGTPIAGRNQRELEGLIGFFVSTLALRNDVRAEDRFVSLLAREKTVALAAYDHQETPFELVVDALQLERRLDLNPLFQVWFVHQNIPRAIGTLGQDATDLDTDSVSSKFDLALYSAERGDEIELTWHYKPELFDGSTIDRLIEHFETLLSEVVADPDIRIHALLAQPIATVEPETMAPTTIWDRFTAVADERGAHVAVLEAERAWTYAMLRERADAIGARIDELGAGERVACLLSHGAEMVAGILGVLASGRAYVPLDASHPEERSSFVLADSGASAILCDAATAALAGQLAGHRPLIRVDEARAGQSPRRRPRPDSLAYCLYTSGSTGRPKGVLQQHAHVVHFIDAYCRHLAIAPTDVLSLLSTFAFDAAVVDVFSALLSGATLAPYDLRREGLAGLADALVRRDVTIYHSTPTVFRALVQSEARLSSRVRAVALGGEEVRADDVHHFRAAFSPTAILVNGYGMTECSWALLHTVHPGDAVTRPSVPLGAPIDRVRVSLQTPLGPQLAPYGVGTIQIASPMVARGYWQRPEETAVAFPAPDTYVTSDLGRLLPDGRIEFAGRHASLVKLRGLRIDLREIEAVLAEHPELAKSAVVLHDGPRGEEIVAYVVGASGNPAPSASAIREHLATKLPDYMVPAIVVPLAALPVGATGKLDRKSLPPPEQFIDSTAYVAPRTPTEKTLAEIWVALLGVDRISVHDDFFDLGGNSLMVMRLLARMRATFGVDLPMHAIFETSTLEQLAAASDSKRTVPVETIGPAHREAYPQLSFAQQRLWFLQQLEPDSLAYQLGYTRRFEGLDLEILRRAFEALIQRHEGLRTTFPVHDGEPYQLVHPPGPWTLEITDARALGAAAQDAALHAGEKYVRRSFDLATGPLLRTHVVRVADDAFVLFVGLHHIITDGGSYAIFWRDLWAYYDAFVAGTTASLPVLDVQYADYAAQQRAWIQGPELDRQLAFWTTLLRGAPEETALPFKGPRPARQTFRGRLLELPFTPELAANLRALARREGTSLFMTFAASLRALLARYTGQRDILLGTAITNRSSHELEHLIGMFVNTVVLRTEIHGDDTFGTLLAREKTNALAAFDHQHTPFELVVDALDIERSLSRPPVFQVMYIHQHETDAPMRGQTVARALQPAASYDLTVHSWETDEGLGISVVHNEDLFDHAIVEQMFRHYVRVLEITTRDPQLPLATLPLLDEGDHAQLRAWNDTAKAVAEPHTIHALVAAQAARTPDAIAVAFEGIQLTYRELVDRIERVAGWLCARGVTHGHHVTVAVERSADMIVATLAVLRAGAAYVPIDPEYPAHRRELMRQDVGAAIELTDASLRDALMFTARAPHVDVAAEDVAYVLYTSGSTGQPKGVRVPHRAVVNFLHAMRHAPGIAATDTLLAVTTLSFDIAGLELYLPLIVGATVVVASRDTARDGARLAELLASSRATIMQATPATWRMLLAAGWRPSPRLRILCGGEALPPDLAATLLAGAESLWNLYGPTETTIWSTCIQITPDQPITIGRPIDNTRVYILDGARQKAPIGVAGEVYIGGRGVALGYHARPELTAERFVADPFVADLTARMYRTGDRARWRSDGTLEYLGRVDTQIKLRGFRIELGEIEVALRMLVEDAAVLVREDTPGNRQLVAYVVAETAVDVAALRSALKATLPDYMVPSAFVTLAAFPLTPNGKLDRGALPAPERVSSEAYVAPRTEQEAVLASVWAELLGVDRVGIHDDFFALGGHSLLAIRLLAGVERRLGVKVPLRELFVDSTLGGLAARVSQARAGAVERPTLYASATRRARLPAALRGVFKLNKLMATDLFARHVWSAWIDGPLDLRSLERAVAAMRARHALLSTRFFEDDGREMLEVLTPVDVERFALLDRADLSDLPVDDQANADTEFHRSVSFRPLDVGHGEVMSVALSRWSETRHRLTISLHNIASDAESLTVYVNELCELWRAFAADPARDPVAVLPPAPLQYHHLADYLERVHESEAGRAQRAFWAARLEGMQPLELPIDSPREQVDARREANAGVVAFPSASVVGELPNEVLTALERIAESQHATVMSTLVATMAGYLSERTSQRDLAFVTRLSHRYIPGLERALGFLVNPIVLRVSTEGAPAFSELVERTHAVVTDAFDHGESDLFELAPYSVFRFCLVYTRADAASEAPLPLPDGNVATRAPHPGAAAGSQIGYDLLLWLQHLDGRVRLHLAYNLELFRETTAAEFLEGYIRYVTAACRG